MGTENDLSRMLIEEMKTKYVRTDLGPVTATQRARKLGEQLRRFESEIGTRVLSDRPIPNPNEVVGFATDRGRIALSLDGRIYREAIEQNTPEIGIGGVIEKFFGGPKQHIREIPISPEQFAIAYLELVNQQIEIARPVHDAIDDLSSSIFRSSAK